MPIKEEQLSWKPCSSPGCWVNLIVMGGLISGLSFILFQTVISWVFSGRIFIPVRLFAASVLGMDAVAPTYPRLSALGVGIAMLCVASILCAYLLIALISQFPKLASSSASLIASACVFGYLLWIIDFLVIDRAVISNGIPLKLDPAWQGFIGHVFFYGLVLGFYVDRKQEKTPTVMRIRFRF